MDSSSTLDNSIISLHYVEYDYSEDNGVNLDSSELPLITSVVATEDDQTQYLGGELPDF